MFSPLPAGARRTHDNGTEFAHYLWLLRDGLGMATYFADPYSSFGSGPTRTATALSTTA